MTIQAIQYTPILTGRHFFYPHHPQKLMSILHMMHTKCVHFTPLPIYKKMPSWGWGVGDGHNLFWNDLNVWSVLSNNQIIPFVYIRLTLLVTSVHGHILLFKWSKISRAVNFMLLHFYSSLYQNFTISIKTICFRYFYLIEKF